MTVQGHCDPAFAAVQQVFERNFEQGREVGAALAVYRGDRLVVDLWGGLADRRTGREWQRDTPCFAFSCTKALTATAAHLLAERGHYDVTAPVVDWWPEYGVHGKEKTTAAHLLSHQSGLPAFARPVTAEEAADPAAMAAELAAQAPEWTPGEAHGYHAMTYGWLAGEIVRRHSGRTVGAFVQDEFGADLDLWIGAPDEVVERAAKLAALRGPGGGNALAESGGGTADLGELGRAARDPESLLNRALGNPHPGKGGFNNPVVTRAGWPAAGLTATPRALATFFRRLVDGDILAPATLRDVITPRVTGRDRTLLVDSSFGLGYMRPSQTFLVPPAATATAFGHTGAGGSIGLGDIEHDLALAYIPSGMGQEVSGDLRAYRLVEAVYAAL